jgi:hypothetical protein
MNTPLRVAFLAAVVAAAAGPRAEAAEAYSNCTGFITSLPTTITTQGVWCMDRDLSTALATGAAINVDANNVTIECNGFKLGGLQAGLGTQATGILAYGRSNTTVRGCNIRGFQNGAYLSADGGGYVVEDSRFDSNTRYGIYVDGDGSTIRRNQVLHTGGSTQTYVNLVAAIFAGGTQVVVDNQIADVSTEFAGSDDAVGIHSAGSYGGRIGDNTISGLLGGETGDTRGIYVYDGNGVVIRNNDIAGNTLASSIGIYCLASNEAVRDNTILRAAAPIFNCTDAGGNVDDVP